MLHEWVKLTLLFSVSAVAIAYFIADVTLAIYVAWCKGRRHDLQPLAEVMGLGPVQRVRRFALVHSEQSANVTGKFAKFCTSVLRLTTVPALVGVTSLFVMSMAGVI